MFVERAFKHALKLQSAVAVSGFEHVQFLLARNQTPMFYNTIVVSQLVSSPAISVEQQQSHKTNILWFFGIEIEL